MATCRGCGSYVSDGFTRVFGDNEGNVYSCPKCEGKARGINERNTSKNES